MNFFRWIRWIFSKPRVRIGEVDGRTRLLRSARTEVYGGIKVQWADEQEDRK